MIIAVAVAYSFVALVGLAAAARLAVEVLARRRARRWRRFFEQWQRSFPSSCPVCSFHRYGVTHGFEPAGSPPPPHTGCVEGRR